MRKLIAVFLTIFLSNNLFAQQEKEGIFLQPKVGINISNVRGGNSNTRTGLALGLELEIKTASFMGFSFAGIYSMQGDTDNGNIPGLGYVRMVEKVDYINFPVTANFYITKGLAIRFGIQPGINIYSAVYAESGYQHVEYSMKKLGIEVDDFDLSLPMGVSYEAPFGMVFDARYNLGIESIVNKTDLKNSVFQFTLGYKFEL